MLILIKIMIILFCREVVRPNVFMTTLKVLHDRFDIERRFMTTIHVAQVLLDGE